MGGYLGHVASLPSGRPEICLIREKLLSLLSECGPRQPISAPSTAPFIVHLCDGQFLNRAEGIHVGCVSSPADFSPWCMPLPCESFENNKNFILMRADLHIFLRPLSHKVISCSCTSTDSCWGGFLQNLFIDVFEMDYNSICTPQENHRRGFPVSRYRGRKLFQHPPRGQQHCRAGRALDYSGVSGRHRDLMSSGVQGARGRPGQLIGDGLPPDAHLHRALLLAHPYANFCGTTPARGVRTKMSNNHPHHIGNAKNYILPI